MNIKYLAIALAAAGFISSSASAQESPWLIRARVVNIDTANKSDPIAGTSIGKDQIHVSDKTIPELDITYFFTPHWAAELILTYPQEHNVTVAGSKFGTFKHLPPVLTAQYHFSPESKISPYVGAGINYTRIFSVNLNGGTQLDQSSIGGALSHPN